MYFVDGMDLSSNFQPVFPYCTEGFRLKKIERSAEGYMGLGNSFSMSMDHHMSCGCLVNDHGTELGIFQRFNDRIKILFNSEFIFSQINNADILVNNYYLTFALYLSNDLSFKSFSFDFLYSFKAYNPNNTSKNRYEHHIELMWEDDFISVASEKIRYPLATEFTVFEILADFVLASIYNANPSISSSDHLNLNDIVNGQVLDDRKRYKEFLSMIVY